MTKDILKNNKYVENSYSHMRLSVPLLLAVATLRPCYSDITYTFDRYYVPFNAILCPFKHSLK